MSCAWKGCFTYWPTRESERTYRDKENKKCSGLACVGVETPECGSDVTGVIRGMTSTAGGKVETTGKGAGRKAPADGVL